VNVQAESVTVARVLYTSFAFSGLLVLRSGAIGLCSLALRRPNTERGGDARRMKELWFFQNGRPLAREFHGYADVGEERRAHENTIFHWGSITKTFTGIAIMQLRDRGRLRLEDPVSDYLPELAAAHNTCGEMGQITILHLMIHSAGFRNPTWPGEVASLGIRTSPKDGARKTAFLKQTVWISTPVSPYPTEVSTHPSPICSVTWLS
jgi:CubicO group peptidase (beta-lactamase class C family)